jgi:hypothetical protein
LHLAAKLIVRSEASKERKSKKKERTVERDSDLKHYLIFELLFEIHEFLVVPWRIRRSIVGVHSVQVNVERIVMKRCGTLQVRDHHLVCY